MKIRVITDAMLPPPHARVFNAETGEDITRNVTSLTLCFEAGKRAFAQVTLLAEAAIDCHDVECADVIRREVRQP